MRTFSRLRALCAYPETIDRPSRRRDEAADLGTTFHRHVQAWRDSFVAGRSWGDIDGVSEPVRGWLQRMREVWAPTADLEVEVAMGLADEPAPRYVPVEETEPHVYVPTVTMAVPLLTAGRADLLRPVGEVALVDDIKTGKSYLGDPKMLRQLLAQGIAATLRAGAAGFLPGIYYARLGIFDRGDGEPIWRGSDEWDQAWNFVVSAAKMSSDPRPGAWCLSCWEKNDCPAFPGGKAGS